MSGADDGDAVVGSRTLPSNLALCVNPAMEYSYVQVLRAAGLLLPKDCRAGRAVGEMGTARTIECTARDCGAGTLVQIVG